MLTHFLEVFAGWLIGDILKISSSTLLFKSLTFFVADVIKIFILLFVIIYTVAMIRTFFPPEKTKKLLSRNHTILGNISAALLGVVTPF